MENTTGGPAKLSPRFRTSMNVFLSAAVVAVSVGVASGVLPFAIAGAAVMGLLVGQFSGTDRNPPIDVEGRLGWWKRRSRGAFRTAWWVLIVLTGVLIRTLFVDGADWRAVSVLSIMAISLWIILRKPPERPWDAARLTK